jgi:hypothetical protein
MEIGEVKRCRLAGPSAVNCRRTLTDSNLDFILAVSCKLEVVGCHLRLDSPRWVGRLVQSPSSAGATLGPSGERTTMYEVTMYDSPPRLDIAP